MVTAGWKGRPAPGGTCPPAPSSGSSPPAPTQGPTVLKRTLSKPVALSSAMPRKGQPPFCSQCRPRTPSSTRSMRTRRAPPTAAGTKVARVVSPVGRGACEPWVSSPQSQPHARGQGRRLGRAGPCCPRGLLGFTALEGALSCQHGLPADAGGLAGPRPGCAPLRREAPGTAGFSAWPDQHLPGPGCTLGAERKAQGDRRRAARGQLLRSQGQGMAQPERGGDSRQREGMAQGLALVALGPLRQSHGP